MVVPAVTGVAAVHASTDDYDDPLLWFWHTTNNTPNILCNFVSDGSNQQKKPTTYC